MKARAFGYVRPDTIAAALDAFANARGDAAYIAGGQSLVPALASRLQAPGLLIDIAHVDELRGVELDSGWLRIGALTRHVEALTNPLIARLAPLLREAAPHVAHPAIRNKGTLGGSVALADPASEFPAMMLAMGAEIEIASPDGHRRVPADTFFLDRRQTKLDPGELLVALYVPALRPSQRWAFDELARRRGDVAIVGCGILADIQIDVFNEARVAFFSVGSTPMRARGAEAALVGATFDGNAIANAQAALAEDLDPPDDEHVPASMRLHLARVLLGRLLRRLMEEP